MISPPATVKEFAPSESAFTQWLIDQGGVLLDPTSHWEVIRVRSSHTKELFILYRNNQGKLNWPEPLKVAWHRFRVDQNWDGFVAKVKRGWSATRRKRLNKVCKRDGPHCFFCGEIVPEDERTEEHLLSLSHGGNHHLSNLVMACEPCNTAVADKSIAEKVAYRDMKRGQHERHT